MPLKKLQELIIHSSQYLHETARKLARFFSIDYPYQGPAFDFVLEGDRLKLTDNTQVPVQLEDGWAVMENVNPGRFQIPRRDEVQELFLRLHQWEQRLLENRNHADPDTLEFELEIITGKMLPLSVEMLKYTAESYSMPDLLANGSQDYWTHPPFDISCRSGMLKSGDCVPVGIQLKVEELNDRLRKAKRRLKSARAAELHFSGSPEASRKIIRHLLQEIIVEYAGEMVLAGQRKTPDPDGNAQNPPVASVKDGTHSLPVPVTPTSQAIADSKALSTAEAIRPYPRRRKKKNGTTPKDMIAEERDNAIQAYIDEVFEKTGKWITQTSIWKSLGYKDRSEYERWKRNDPRTTDAAKERFPRFLKEKPHLK